MRCVLCTPTVTKPYGPYLDAVEASTPVCEKAGWEVLSVYEIDNAYVSGARCSMLRKALFTNPDAIVFLDHDVSWGPTDLLRLLEMDDPVIAGTYRFKLDEERYMGGVFVDEAGTVIRRPDGCVAATLVPAGFLKITRGAINAFMEHYPALVFGEKCNPQIDMFNHGAIDGVWWGEDYAFSKRWRDAGGELWIKPDLDITHHAREVRVRGNRISMKPGKAYPGNFARFLDKLQKAPVALEPAQATLSAA